MCFRERKREKERKEGKKEGERASKKKTEESHGKKEKGRKKGGREGGRESHSRLRPEVLKISSTNANFFFINVQNYFSLDTTIRFHFWETVLKEIN